MKTLCYDWTRRWSNLTNFFLWRLFSKNKKNYSSESRSSLRVKMNFERLSENDKSNLNFFLFFGDHHRVAQSCRKCTKILILLKKKANNNRKKNEIKENNGQCNDGSAGGGPSPSDNHCIDWICFESTKEINFAGAFHQYFCHNYHQIHHSMFGFHFLFFFLNLTWLIMYRVLHRNFTLIELFLFFKWKKEKNEKKILLVDSFE